MGRQRAYLAVVDGKRRDSKSDQTTKPLAAIRRLLIAAAVFFAGWAIHSPVYAESGPFASMAGTWGGGGVVTLEDGSKERIRCRAVYAVAGATMNMTLTCASDAYKFQLVANVVDQAGAVSGTWSETTRVVSGTLAGRGGGGNFEVVASSAGFNANISLRTAGNRQSIGMRADSQFRTASMTLSRR